MWTATEYGLKNSFDGLRFANYSLTVSGDSTSINNYVRTLFEDSRKPADRILRIYSMRYDRETNTFSEILMIQTKQVFPSAETA